MTYCPKCFGKMQIIPEEYVWVCEDCGLRMTIKEVALRDSPLGTLMLWDHEKELPQGWDWKQKDRGQIIRVSRENMATKDIPHMLFIGPPGSGKTSTAPQYQMKEIEIQIRVILEDETK